MINIGRYNSIANTDSFTAYKISTKIPTPTDTDYKRGYIRRYFVQAANDPSSYIYEISDTLFSVLKNEPLYLCVNLKWRLIGKPEEVKESNSKAVRLASKTMKQIPYYLPYYLQFYKG